MGKYDSQGGEMIYVSILIYILGVRMYPSILLHLKSNHSKGEGIPLDLHCIVG